jgi:thioredoxin-like negative regulator of GroEL
VGRGLQVAPQYAPLHFTTGLLELAEGNDALAQQALARAVDLVPWLSRYRLTLADLLFTRGDRAAVEGLLAAAPAPDPAIDAYRKKHSL